MLITLRGERVKPILFPQYVLSTPKEFLFLSVIAHCFFFFWRHFFFPEVKNKIMSTIPHRNVTLKIQLRIKPEG